MKKFYIFLALSMMISLNCKTQADTSSETITYYVNASVKNAEEPYAKEIINLWKDYWDSGEYVTGSSPYWSYDGIPAPDYAFVNIILDIRTLRNRGGKIQCNIIGITPVENDHYLMKAMWSNIDSTNQQVKLHYITNVYAKDFGEGFKLVSGPRYVKDVWQNYNIGKIHFYSHPLHTFNKDVAEKMNRYNEELAKTYGIDPMEFDYYVANNTDDLSQMLGYDHFRYSMQPVRTGGMADNYNICIYAGNNKEYYPHEVVHLYNKKVASGRIHRWIDEGIAALFGGSSEYEIDWHIQKLKLYIEEYPDFPLGTLRSLEADIPNGEYITDMRYAIGGLLMQKIYIKKGMQGLLDGLQINTVGDSTFFDFMEDKLGFAEDEFESYVKAALREKPSLSEKEMEDLRY